ncbi:CGGC domain-containing protein [Thermosulfurimonas marina]|uniref:CGGC domain-containing protein n=1 Tax=Thermosulfurimonas marina TaxID=2047767 RepID=A0A6H1WSF1_9BACT|nr:CGGC domain-containing protein [Thermosulfurimonas marina]QJA06112.1 CGGC domain-containing protein [Thermosulfurimonas marina]
MPKVLIVACGSYAETSHSCVGDWKCLSSAAEKKGPFAQYPDEVKVMGFLRCKCPGRSLVANIAMAKEKTGFEVVHLTNCLAKAQPACKNHDLDQLVQMIKEKTGAEVVIGTHDLG